MRFTQFKSKCKRVFRLLEIVIVFVTTYALILPALTLDQDKVASDPAISVTNMAETEAAKVPVEIVTEAVTQAPIVHLEQEAPQQVTELVEPAPAVTDAAVNPPPTQPESTESQAPVQVNEEPTGEEKKAEKAKEVAKKPRDEKKALIKKQTTLSSEIDGASVSVQVDASAQVPEGVEVRVDEIISTSSQFQGKVDQAKSLFSHQKIADARIFDISLLSEKEEIEPASSVKVSIKMKKALSASDDQIKLIHLHGGKAQEILDKTVQSANGSVQGVTFTTDSFSDFIIAKVEDEKPSSSQNADNASTATEEKGAESRSIAELDTAESALPSRSPAEVQYYTVKFVLLDDEGNEQVIANNEIKALEGAKVGHLPENPFKEGYHFKGWKNKESGNPIDADTLLTGDITAVAVFEKIDIYTVTIQYYYHNIAHNADEKLDQEVHQLEESDTPYQITPPASTEVTKQNDPGLTADVIYYPEIPIIEIKAGELASRDAADGTVDQKITIRLKYVPYTAEYDFVYKLKNLNNADYTEFKRVHAYGILNSTVTAQILSFPYANFERAETKKIIQASGQELVVYYTRNNYTLSYDSKGGTYIPPQTDLYEKSIPITTTVPEKNGYTFVGWYTDPSYAAGTEVTTSNIKLDKNITLYAKWEAKNVNYLIAYYKEYYDNSTNTTRYVYDNTVTSTAKVGTTVQATSAPGLATVPTGYERESDYGMNANSAVIIDANGQSVLKVYYSLIRYTFIFDLKNSNGRITIGGRTYRDNQYQITNVVLGQDISSQWPSSTSNPKEVYDDTTYYNWFTPYWKYFDYWSPNFKTRRYEVTGSMLPTSGRTRTYAATWNSSGNQASVEYWLQEPDGSFKKSDKYSQGFIRTGTLDPKDIYGYDFLDGTPNGYQPSQTYANPYVYRFYYTRQKFKIDYYYGSTKLKSENNILFDANINLPKYDYIPDRPSGVDADYQWGGWYADSAFNNKYIFNKMPSTNQIVYAKWIAPTFRVTFDVNDGDSPTPPMQTIEKYKLVDAPDTPSRAYHDFIGWYTAKEGGTLFDLNQPITRDTQLFAHWKAKPITYTVQYLDKVSGGKLSADKVITNPALKLGQEISEEALGIAAYRPDRRTKSITLNHDNNVLTFYYTSTNYEVDYTIRYVLDSNPAIEVAPSKTKRADGSMINAKEMAAQVDKTHMATQQGVTQADLDKDYHPISEVQSIVLSSDAADNVITFRYLDYNTALIKVNYLDMDGNPITGIEPFVKTLKKPATFRLEHPVITGYTYNHSEDISNPDMVESAKATYAIQGGERIVINLYYKKNITIVAAGDSKVYDGQPLRNSGIEDLVDNYSDLLKEGDRLVAVTYDGSQTDVGQSPSKPKDLKIVDASGKDHTAFYYIVYVPGNLEVTALPITVIVTGEMKEKFYNATSETIGYDVQIVDQSGLYKKENVSFIGDAENLTKTDAGIYHLQLENLFLNTNDNFEVTFNVTDGQLTIKPRKVVLTSASKTKAYDGQVLTDHTVTPTTLTLEEGFVPGEGVETYTVTGSQTKPGSSENAFTYQLKAGTKVQNYDLTMEFGKLTVLPTINIQKTNQDWQPLAGGKFTISKVDGTAQTAVDGAGELSITTVDGVNIPVGLPEGTYLLTETAAPNGYIVMGDQIRFTVVENPGDNGSNFTVHLMNQAGELVNSTEVAKLLPADGRFSNRIQITNEKGKALPSTGGIGKLTYTLSGITVMLIGGILTLLNKKRKLGGGSH